MSRSCRTIETVYVRFVWGSRAILVRRSPRPAGQVVGASGGVGDHPFFDQPREDGPGVVLAAVESGGYLLIGQRPLVSQKHQHLPFGAVQTVVDGQPVDVDGGRAGLRLARPAITATP